MYVDNSISSNSVMYFINLDLTIIHSKTQCELYTFKYIHYKQLSEKRPHIAGSCTMLNVESCNTAILLDLSYRCDLTLMSMSHITLRLPLRGLCTRQIGFPPVVYVSPVCRLKRPSNVYKTLAFLFDAVVVGHVQLPKGSNPTNAVSSPAFCRLSQRRFSEHLFAATLSKIPFCRASAELAISQSS